MEEKERYELFGEHCIKDNNPDARCQLLNTYQVYVILNEQDKRIKELEEENKFLEKRNEKLTIDRRDFCLERNDIFEENQQLKQQLHDLPKKIMGEIKKELYDCGKTYLEDEPYIEICIVKGILDRILKKYGGENDN